MLFILFEKQAMLQCHILKHYSGTVQVFTSSPSSFPSLFSLPSFYGELHSSLTCIPTTNMSYQETERERERQAGRQRGRGHTYIEIYVSLLVLCLWITTDNAVMCSRWSSYQSCSLPGLVLLPQSDVPLSLSLNVTSL